MKDDSLGELRSAFAEWRRRKKHAREAVPEELLARARRATEKHGVRAVVGVTRVERARLFRSRPAGRRAPDAKTKGEPRSVPTFSRGDERALVSEPPPDRRGRDGVGRDAPHVRADAGADGFALGGVRVGRCAMIQVPAQGSVFVMRRRPSSC